MTDPIKRISGAQGTSAGGRYSGGSFSERHKKSGPIGPQHDVIEISQDARERSGGKKKGGIIEYLKELLGF